MEQVEQSVLLDCTDSVGVVTINRPAAGNAITETIRLTLPKILEQLDGDPSISVVVLAGAGDRGFCVGANIKEARAVGTAVEERKRLIANAWIDRIARLKKPVIAAIHGYCLGGGLEIAMACDIRIASADAVFGLPETGLGLIPGGGGTQRLPRLIGQGRALDMILSGDRVNADEAIRIGLVTRIVPERNGLAAAAFGLAQQIAARPPTASLYAKEAIRRGMEVDIDAGLTLEKSLFALLMPTNDRAEAASAFREKRPPRFTGN